MGLIVFSVIVAVSSAIAEDVDELTWAVALVVEELLGAVAVVAITHV